MELAMEYIYIGLLVLALVGIYFLRRNHKKVNEFLTTANEDGKITGAIESLNAVIDFVISTNLLHHTKWGDIEDKALAVKVLAESVKERFDADPETGTTDDVVNESDYEKLEDMIQDRIDVRFAEAADKAKG